MRAAVYTGTRNLYGDMETAAKSLIANSDVDKVYFLIEDAEFPTKLPPIIECVDVSGQRFFRPDGPNMSSGFTYMVLLRAAFSDMFDLDMIVGLDSDAICLQDVSALWDTDLDGVYFAAAREPDRSCRELTYTNMGVTVYNLAKLRDGKAAEIIDVLDNHRFTWMEQDVFNSLCQGRIGILDGDFNACNYTEHTDHPRIVHYAARNDWRGEPCVREYRDMPWDEVMRRHAMVHCGTVLFTSDHDLDRAENLKAVYDAYDGPKVFAQGTQVMETVKGFSVVVCDTLPRYMPEKDCKVVIIHHSILAGKLYALDEKRPGIDPRAFSCVDYAVAQSTKNTEVLERSFNLPPDKIAPLGMPRTDYLVGKRKGDGGTFAGRYRRTYLYVPTFRGAHDGSHLPRIDWEKLDGLMENDELLLVKRHYFQGAPILDRQYAHIVELDPNGPSGPYIVDCDVIVTDYSSIMLDGYIAGKPSVLTVDDMEDYLSTRGMYLDYPSAYSSRWVVAEDNEEGLLALMRAACEEGMTQTEIGCRDLVADMCDGHSTERVCDLVRRAACGCL